MPDAEHRLQAVLDLCDRAEQGAIRWRDPLPVPDWVAAVRAAATGQELPRAVPQPGEAQAAKNMQAFVTDLRSHGVPATGYSREPELDYTDNWYCFGITMVDGSAVEIHMPDAPFDQVHYTGEGDQYIGDFRQIRVDGSWWYWKFAVSACRRDED